MTKHHTKNKGDLGVLKAQLDLFKKGWLILNPLTEHAPFDLVVWKDGVFKTVQVKYREIDKFGAVTVKLSSSWADKNGSHTNPMDKKFVDFICIYCPDTDICYYCDPKKFNCCITLRIKESNNNQKSNINNANDFLNLPL